MFRLKRSYLKILVILLCIVSILIYKNFSRFQYHSDKIPKASEIKKIVIINLQGGKTTTNPAEIKKLLSLVDSNNIVGAINDRGSVAGGLYTLILIHKDIFIKDQYLDLYSDTFVLEVSNKISHWYRLKSDISVKARAIFNSIYVSPK